MKRKTYEAEDPQQTQFNSALASLERLHKWLFNAGLNAMAQDYVHWKLALDVVHRELSSYIDKEEGKKLDEMREQIQLVFDGMHQYARRKNIAVSNVLSPLTQMLPAYEIEMRKLAKIHGLLIPDKPSALDFM